LDFGFLSLFFRFSGKHKILKIDDETMFGGKKPGKRGWGATGKWIVFGIY